MLRKTSQFSGKAKPNTQHLNLSESFCWVSLGVLLGFLTTVESVGWVERINMLRKTSQFSGKAKPNTQHLNLSESFCWVSLGVLLGFLGCIVGFRASTQPTVETQHPTPHTLPPPTNFLPQTLDTRSILNLTPKKAIDLTARFLALG
jgi:hypothetical protein